MSPTRLKIQRSAESENHKKSLEKLCTWIDVHLDEPVGWQELMRESGLDFQVIHYVFLKYAKMSPMTWIRKRREGQALPPGVVAMPAPEREDR
jgi:methylphosphotriester-DNA--protein-cysteine methyltransferase